jgi:hypothetical protein
MISVRRRLRLTIMRRGRLRRAVRWDTVVAAARTCRASVLARCSATRLASSILARCSTTRLKSACRRSATRRAVRGRSFSDRWQIEEAAAERLSRRGSASSSVPTACLRASMSRRTRLGGAVVLVLPEAIEHDGNDGDQSTSRRGTC